MAASPSQGSEYNQIVIYSFDGSKNADLKSGVVEFQYFEDLYSPTFTATLSVVNTAAKGDDKAKGIYHDLPIQGGEKVHIDITTPIEMHRKSKGEFVVDMYVNGISNYVQEKNMESFTLQLVSKESIINQNTRIIQKFVSKKISELIEVFLKAVKLKEDQWDIEETRDKINFIGNMRKPYTLAPMLANRARPVEGGAGTAGFFFWQTRTKMNFKSIESLIKAETKAEYEFERIVDTHGNAEKNFKKVLTYELLKSSGVIDSARAGEYSTYRIYFNPHTFGFTQHDSAMAGTWDKIGGEHLGTEEGKPAPVVDPDPKGDGENKFTKPYMAHRIVSGINATGCMEPKVDTTVVQPQTHDVAQSIWRYGSLFSQVMTLTVPVNIGLFAGDKIECLFPQVSGEDDIDSHGSGLYIIKEISHFFEPNRSYTAMKVLRDTSGQKK